MTSKYEILLNNYMNEFDKESGFMEESIKLRPNPVCAIVTLEVKLLSFEAVGFLYYSCCM